MCQNGVTLGNKMLGCFSGMEKLLRTILIDCLFCCPFCVCVWILVFLPLNKAASNYSLMDSSWCCCHVCSSEWQNQGCTQVAKTSRQNPSICRRKIMNLCQFAVWMFQWKCCQLRPAHMCNFPSFGGWVGRWGMRWGCPDGPLISTRCWYLRKRTREMK